MTRSRSRSSRTSAGFPEWLTSSPSASKSPLATVRPFQGIFYDPQRVDLARVVAPPYDVISPADQRRFYQQHPHNVVRLIAGEVRPTATPEDNKYTRAAGFFRQWLAEGNLCRSSIPWLQAYPRPFCESTDGQRRERQGVPERGLL